MYALLLLASFFSLSLQVQQLFRVVEMVSSVCPPDFNFSLIRAVAVLFSVTTFSFDPATFDFFLIRAPSGARNQDVVPIAVGPQVSTVPILTEGMAPSFSMLPSVISITPYSSRSSPKCLLEPDTADVISQINSDMTLFLTSCRLRCKSRLASVFSEMRDKK